MQEDSVPDDKVLGTVQNKTDATDRKSHPSSPSSPMTSGLLLDTGSEVQDVLSELPMSPHSKLRKQRSDTESRSGKILLSIKGRMRSYTLQEGESPRVKEEQEVSVIEAMVQLACHCYTKLIYMV